MEDDYESLPSTSSLQHHMLAGACAGILEHTVMYPVDCVKTRLQCLRPDSRATYSGLVDGLVQICKREGFLRSLRGIGAVVGGSGPAHALYFACYEHVKKNLASPEYGVVANQLSYGLAGCTATLLHDAIMTPADAVKQRVQMYNSPYQSSCSCLRSVIRSEGPSALFRAYVAQLSMNLPHQAVHFMVYEGTQDILNKERHYHPLSHMISGALAGAAAASVTTPLDVCKTLLNTQERCALAVLPPGITKVSGLLTAVRVIYRLGGVSAFFKGLQARVIFQMPGTAISWSVYEYFKFYLREKPLDANPAS